MKELSAGKTEVAIDNSMNDMYTDFIAKRGKDLEADADKKVPVDRSAKQMLEAVHKATVGWDVRMKFSNRVVATFYLVDPFALP